MNICLLSIVIFCNAVNMGFSWSIGGASTASTRILIEYQYSHMIHIPVKFWDKVND